MAVPLIAIAKGLISIAPSVAGWLGGDKAEEAAEKVVGIAKQVTGISDPQEAVNQVLADPSMQLEYLLNQNKMQVQFDAMYLEDRKDARHAHKDNHMPAILSIMLTLVVATFAWALFNVEIPESNKELTYVLFGNVLTAWVGSMAYWFGTSKGSADKNKMMAKL